jgi:hypothetical protein
MAEHEHEPEQHEGHFEYRSTIFEQKTFGDHVRDLFKKAPYFMISLALTTTCLALATVMKLSEEKKQADAKPIEAGIAKSLEDKPKEEEVKKRDIFDTHDAAVEQIESEVQTNEPELTFPDSNFVYGDHNETDNGEDFGMAKGSGNDFTMANSQGKNMFDSIGVGGGSGRGGKGGYGGPFGGRRNMTVRGGKGASAKTESAVEAGLRWLARHQDDNGAWSPDGFTKNCQGGTVCEHAKGFGYPEYETGNTGLALLAFLGAGYDHRSPKQWTDPFSKKVIRVGDVVKKGLLFLKDRQDEAGNICEAQNPKWGYNHSIGTLAMTEAYGLSRAPQWKGVAQKAIDALVNGQNPAPGGTGLWAWRYRPQCGDNDISVTGWAVMALKSAELAGLRFSQGSMDGAFNFCEEVTDKTTGHVGYTKREEAGQQVKALGKNDDHANHPALAAVGMCVRTFVRHNSEDPMLEAGAKLMIKDLPKYDKAKKTVDFYYWYYGSLALNQFDGPESPRANKGGYWKEWEAALKKALLDNQVNNPKLCADGSWDGDDRWGVDGGGRVYSTAINTLTFEVYYRYSNSFGTVKKKDAKGGAAPPREAKPGEAKPAEKPVEKPADKPAEKPAEKAPEKKDN